VPVTPNWQAATSGQPGLAAQVNQYLGAHGSQWIYQGARADAQAAGSGLYVSTAGQYLAQAFTAAGGQTVTGQVWLQISAVGGSPVIPLIAPLIVSLYASLPGAALVTVTVPEQYVYLAPFWLPVPLPAAGLTPGARYWVVTSPAGGVSAYYTWQESNQVSGASTSPDGITWTAQPYGMMYQVYDQSPAGPLTHLWEDSGSRWTAFGYDAAGRLTAITETTAAQAGGQLVSARALTYTDALVTGVS
jgi:YD repeat-containing protein